MKIAVLGTGIVGRSHAEKLASLGHDVMIGTEDVAKKMADTKTDAMNNVPFPEWQKKNPSVKLATFRDAAAHGEIVYDALKGDCALDVLKSVGAENLNGKIIVDIANPLDFSKGMPPTLTVCNTDSLGEEVQRTFPEAKVVKTFNTTNALLQVNPQQLANADHDMFLCGNDADAKAKVTEILKSYGWKNINDLGDITAARGMEMMLPVWLRLWGALKTPMFNFKIVKQ